ncbi:hypothetical protein K2173_017067 [Erythroxylum novogranatense]|uniref:CLAVATA3/ESR (CLE)-related protein 27 n=1 Tax=Erythroxylum novogranatense TaxID=1862640 RepID=A0AAV8U5Q2_9ROSI|nr:hypothetical protein K2173_017067 [Erythroxylum novogranatense]
MSFGSSTRLVYSSSLVVVLVFILLQVWVCRHCEVGAIRVLSESGKSELKNTNIVTENVRKEDIFRDYFKGKGYSFNKTDEKGLEDSKRTVPSCPDPLHN